MSRRLRKQSRPRSRSAQVFSQQQQEPLLLDDDDNRNRIHNATSACGHVELLEHTSMMDAAVNNTYQPPVSQRMINRIHEEDDGVNDDFICFPAPLHHHTGGRISFQNENPAVDLAIPLLSHGCCCCQCVRTQEIAFTEHFGRFERILGPGCYCMLWPVDSISGRLSLRIQQMDVTCETKTLDNVFCHVVVSILYRVNVLHCYDAYYRVVDPCILIQTCVLDVLRSSVPSTMTLDRLYESKRDIADRVFTRLQEDMGSYGYEIVQTLLARIMPNARVKASMNEVNASKRIKMAAPHKAEARKLELIYHAQAQAEGDYLRGVGIARERQAIVEGMKKSIQLWTDVDVRVVNPPNQKEVMDLLLVSQYLDMLTAVGCENLQLNHGPSEVPSLRYTFLR